MVLFVGNVKGRPIHVTSFITFWILQTDKNILSEFLLSELLRNLCFLVEVLLRKPLHTFL